MIPREIDGRATDPLLSFRMCIIASTAQQFSEHLPEDWDIGTISTATANFGFAEKPSLAAYRFPGHQAELAREAVYLVLPVDPANASEEHLGGKQVTVFPEWGTVYVYVNGEVLYALSDSNRAHAKQILAALP